MNIEVIQVPIVIGCMGYFFSIAAVGFTLVTAWQHVYEKITIWLDNRRGPLPDPSEIIKTTIRNHSAELARNIADNSPLLRKLMQRKLTE